MHVLTIDHHADRYFGGYASWNVTFMRGLVSSGLFRVERAAMPRFPKRFMRSEHWTTFAVNGRVIGLETWDGNMTVDGWIKGVFKNELADVKTVIRLQWQPEKWWPQLEADGIKVMPWTMHPGATFPLGAFRYDVSANHEYMGVISGASRWRRNAYADAARGNGFEVLPWARRKRLPMNQYVEKLSRSRWQICLAGKRGTDCKNRREVEGSSCGMPLALNYMPHYPFPYRPGVEYVYLPKPESLHELKGIDPRPFAEASDRIYRDHFSPIGSAQTLLSVLG